MGADSLIGAFRHNSEAAISAIVGATRTINLVGVELYPT